jgi:hypothetical protein
LILADDPLPAANETAIKADLRVDRRECHPGESVELHGFLTNTASKELKLAGVSVAWPYAFVHLYITTPNAEEYLYDPYADHPLRRSISAISSRSSIRQLAPAAEQSAFQRSLRLTDGLAGWVSRQHPHGPLSLRAPGDYRVWFEYRVPAIAGAPQDAWTGTARSNTVVLTVAELPAPTQGDKPTAEQLEAIAKLQSVAPTSIEGREFLQQAMLRAENEALAKHLIDLCLQDARREEDFMAMLVWRACVPGSERGSDGAMQLGIDGPSLKTAALATIDVFEHPPKDPNHHRMFRSGHGVDIAIAYLRFHPEDQQARGRLIQIAKQFVPLPPRQPQTAKGPPFRKSSEQTEPAPLPTVAAWQILMELGVLHADMTVGDAIEILGPPSGQNDQTLTWYLDTPRHVNPGLSATLKGDRITKFRRFSG